MSQTKAKRMRPPKIWIDLDNSPHVLFFAPIIHALEKEGVSVLITVRNYSQVIGLANLFGLTYRCIGRHYGGSKIMKVLGLVIRSLSLMPTILKERPNLAVSHGSRSQLLLAYALRIPSVLAMDYEHAQAFTKPSLILAPEALKSVSLEKRFGRVLYYPGIKENVYINNLPESTDLYKQLGLDPDHLIVTVRPPATAAHYFVEKSKTLFEQVMRVLGEQPHAQIIILPRTEEQKKNIRHNYQLYFDKGVMQIPETTVHAVDLITLSDLVISGGGTMNREAAVLGVPVYSIFGGKVGAVDAYLEKQGKLVFLKDETEIQNKLKLVRRSKTKRDMQEHSDTLDFIVRLLLGEVA